MWKDGAEKVQSTLELRLSNHQKLKT